MRPFSIGIAALVAGSRFPVIGGNSEQRKDPRCGPDNVDERHICVKADERFLCDSAYGSFLHD